MPADFPSREVSPLVGLFQKAHGRISALNRLDEQIANLTDQRRRIQEEVRTIQADINNEFDRVMKARQGGNRAPGDRGDRTPPLPIETISDANGQNGAGDEDLTEAIALEALGAAARAESMPPPRGDRKPQGQPR